MLEFYWTNHSMSEDLDHKFSFVYFQQQSTNSDMKEKERERGYLYNLLIEFCRALLSDLRL